MRRPSSCFFASLPPCFLCFLYVLGFLCLPASLRASSLHVPPEATRALELIYAGHPDEALPPARDLQKQNPDHPLGYLLEADAMWWKLYCAACQIAGDGLVDAWRRPKLDSDRNYFRLAERAIQIAEKHIGRRETAEMRFYAGMGYAMRGRLLGLRSEYRATASAGKRMREHLVRSTQLDPNLADAYLGLGLYNYYVDTLSFIARIVRVFMGLPGGDKKTGTKQLELAAAKGRLISVEADFYLAKCLRNYDREYARSTALFEKLVASYPANPLFRIMLAGNLIRVNQLDRAEKEFGAVAQPPAPGSDTPCADWLRELAGRGLNYTRSLKVPK
ncbi:MAG TPA: hypothetical protein VIH17_06980 [Candidatus Acidoferrales bacterium]